MEQISKGEIDRLGLRIQSNNGIIQENDLLLLQEYRKSFKKPIANVFSFVLKASRKIDSTSIVTCRIKRLDTIIEKIQRFEGNTNGDMHLSRMWDIAGCRCIFNAKDNEKIYRLLDEIYDEYGSDCKTNDYIKFPRESGYRSVHIYVKDRESGEHVEIQIRNTKQHNWATLVEIVDLLYNTSLKEGRKSGRLNEFLQLYSNAEGLSEHDFSRMLRIERKMRIFEKMSSTLTCNFNIRIQWLNLKTVDNFYVIVASRSGSSIESFNTFEDAENDYFGKYSNRGDANIVLTHISRNPTFKQISLAYSNYILAMHDFLDDYRLLIEQGIIESVIRGNISRLLRYFSLYRRNVKYHFKDLTAEINGIRNNIQTKTINHSQANKWINSVQERIKVWADETRSFFERLGIVSKDNILLHAYIQLQKKHLVRLG